MRFKSKIKAVNVLAKVCASLSSLSGIAWCRLTDEDVQFTVIPDKGSQCWCKLNIDTIFEKYTIQSASEKNTINLELPLPALSRALKSAAGSHDVMIRLTKKDNVPILCLTIMNETRASFQFVVKAQRDEDEFGDFDIDVDLNDPEFGGAGAESFRDRNTVITQDIPVKVLPMQSVSTLHEPRLREPDVHIYMPNLAQLKGISEKFTKLAISTATGSITKSAPRLEMCANMHGQLKLGVKTDALSISSHWTGLVNPELDAAQFDGGSQA
ncbi:Checkpoint protein hus1, partial [Elasticomyces elasticus]